MSDSKSSYFDIHDDPYTYIIGQPRPKPEVHHAMESWSDTIHHPNLGKTIDRLHNWEKSSYSVSFGEYGEDGVYELSTTYVVRGTGVIEDVHGHYILGGSLLAKVKNDFDHYVIGSWQTARSIHKEFPHHTNVKLSRVLDPSKDPQPRGLDTGAYIEVKSSDIKGYADMCLFRTRTPKGTSFFEGKIYYFYDGTVGRTESRIIRNTYRTFIVKTFLGGRYNTEQIEYIYDSKYGVIREISKAERRRLMTEKDRWEKKQRAEKERIERQRQREQKAAEAAAKEAERIAASDARKERSEEIERYIVEHYDECTQAEMARALGITPKAVEHRVGRLRQKGLVPLSRGSNVYRDRAETEEENRLSRLAEDKRREQRAAAAAEKERRKEEDKARRMAEAQHEQELSARMDQYIVEYSQDYTYASIALALGISESAVQTRVSRLRKEGRIPPADPRNSSYKIGFFSYAGKKRNPPAFNV